MSDPLLFSLVQDLEFQTGYRIKQVVATRGDINDAIETGYPDKALMRTTPESRAELAVRERETARSAAGRASRCRARPRWRAASKKTSSSRSPASRSAAKPRRSSISSTSS